MDWIISSGILAILSILSYILLRRNRRTRPPPGPFGYPIVGSTFSIDLTKIHLSLSELAEKYGDVFQINIVGKTVVVLNSLQTIREAFVNEPNGTIFADRVKSDLTYEMYHGLTDILFASYSKVWVKRRKLGHKVIKAYGEGMRYIETNICEQLQQTDKDIKDKEGKLFDPEEIIDRFLIQVVAILITGRRMDFNDQFTKSMADHESTLNRIFSPEINFMLDWLPFMKHFPCEASRRYTKFKKCQKSFEEQIRIEKDNGSSKGIIHALFSEMNKMADKGENWLTEESIYAILSNVVGGDLLYFMILIKTDIIMKKSILTSKGTMWSGISILLHRPDVQENLQAEVDGVVGSGRQPCLADREYMPYTDAFVLEVLRYISHLPNLIPHCTSTDTQLAGYDIKMNSMIFPNVWKVHHDSSVYTEPFDFKPERFLDVSGGLLPADHKIRQSMLSFSVGKRSCIGEAFAKNRLFLFFSTLMQNFTFLPEENGKRFDLLEMEVLGANMTKKFKCCVKNR